MDRKRAQPRTRTRPPPGGAWTFDVASEELRLSPGARALLDLPAAGRFEQLLARAPVGAGERKFLRAALRRCIAAKGDFDLRMRLAPDHGGSMVRLVGGAVADADGAVRRVAGAAFAADEEARLWGEVEERAAQLSSIMETALDGMVVIDGAGIMQSFSRSAERMFGYSAAEAIGQSVNILMPEPDCSRHDGYMHHYLATGERRIIGVGRIVTGRRRDGSPFPLHLSIGETNVEGRRLFTGFMHDLTEARRTESRTQALQAELAHISRLSALGEMGSALAHELNQPLAAIGNYITGSRRLLADAGLPSAAKIEGALERAAEQVLRAGQIIRRLRDFVSRRAGERKQESVAKLVEEAAALGLVGAREKGVALKFELDPAHDALFADRIQIQQVLVNLLRNGLDAMDASERRELAVSSRLVAPGVLEIAVADTGPGIAAEAMARLFEPFFTTKVTGLGVGLSISRGIVEAHGGQMWAHNNADGGATFRLTLPLRGGSAA
ncbi:MAG: PAS domain S-box protein [Pseudomonadota bacterium]|nr:PAS domain S-box protein [Pseudomonadota bacterium]